MHETKNRLAEEVRSQSANLLNARLADTMDLYMQLKQAHWNVKGDAFIGLHQLFDQVAAIMLAHVDEIAERVTALGGTAQGTIAEVAENTTLRAYPLDIFDGPDHLDACVKAFAAFGSRLRQSISQVNDLVDPGTEDLFIAILRDVDKYQWFLEAHLQKQQASPRPKLVAES